MRHETAIAPQPREGSLDHPTPPYNFEAALFVGAFDDLQIDGLTQECRLSFGSAYPPSAKILTMKGNNRTSCGSA
jgi:hypothetical protein